MEEGVGQPGCSVCGVIEATHASCRALRRTQEKLVHAQAQIDEAFELLVEAEKSCVNPVAAKIRKFLKNLEIDEG